MISLAGFTRRRKALVAAFVPYLLLSVFVDFVHLHRLISGPAQTSAALHLKAGDDAGSKLPETSCAICQWVRGGTGTQTSVPAYRAPAIVTSAIVARSVVTFVRPDLGSPDFRGPPSALSL